MQFTQSQETKRFIAVLNDLKNRQIVNSWSDFSDKVGYSKQSLSHIMNGKRDVTVDLISKSCTVFGLNPVYIHTGEGEYLSKRNDTKNNTVETTVKNTFENQKQIETTQKNKYTLPVVQTSQLNETTQNYSIVKDINGQELIPVVDISAAAGGGYINQDYLTQTDVIRLPDQFLKGGHYICVRVKGASMSPTLQDSSFLVIRLVEKGDWQYIKENQIHVVSDNEGKTFVKRVKNRFKEHDFITLMSDNPDKATYPNFNLHTEEILSIWYAEWYLSAKMPNIHDNFYSKVSRLEDSHELLKEEIDVLTKEVARLKANH
jgi:phage repressor protein C with HTH and peptisase S24 domain